MVLKQVLTHRMKTIISEKVYVLKICLSELLTPTGPTITLKKKKYLILNSTFYVARIKFYTLLCICNGP